MDNKARSILLSSLIVVAVLVFSLAIAKPGVTGAYACNDGLDNDGDTYIDYPSDTGCGSKYDSSELNPYVACDDGKDNGDADSLIDYPDDAGCWRPLDYSETDGNCDDALDNDYDGYINYPSDPECTSYASKEGNCADTDGGYQPTIQGTTSGATGGVPYENTDVCFDSITVTENYCGSNGAPLSSNYGCSNTTTSCVNGACV